MAIFLNYFVSYMLIIIFVVSTSLNEQWSQLKETIAADRPTLQDMLNVNSCRHLKVYRKCPISQLINTILVL